VHRVVNGEIYMHVALREQHERRGHEFASCSPSEVIARACEQWGPTPFGD
jgi:asparagine synthetase B (glutamine-hydrolysing)